MAYEPAFWASGRMNGFQVHLKIGLGPPTPAQGLAEKKGATAQVAQLPPIDFHKAFLLFGVPAKRIPGHPGYHRVHHIQPNTHAQGQVRDT